ncbi:hypothetical protein B0J11DRAFT_64427 [Dendryphion nanum]|uniref:Uncharacterized protein n=1 Tax=Dendryphion nanum TaxID=256645 RepID=A0A9P9DI37_9PLEO|nr:hypothetical protein B0J11DRAFT_64427 [Dendryphion nanum]
MAGPLLNLTIFTKSRAHTLRAISVATFPPGFFFLLIHGIATQRVNPAIGIIPLFLSASFSALLLANEKRCGCQSSGLSGTPIHLVVDLLLGIGLLVCLILSWVFLERSYGGGIMFGTYCTNFLIVNFSFHLYFVLSQIWDALQPGASYPASCPQCQFGPFTISKGGMRNGYAPLLDGDGEPTGSAEDARNAAESAV